MDPRYYTNLPGNNNFLQDPNFARNFNQIWPGNPVTPSPQVGAGYLSFPSQREGLPSCSGQQSMQPNTWCSSYESTPKSSEPRPAKKAKAVAWSDAESMKVIEAWGARYSELKCASNKQKTKIWNEIYATYKRNWANSERTLPQVKKRVQNLQYEFKNLKQRSRNTGEEGLNKIKEGFPFYDQLDDIMGHRDSVDPEKMELEGTSVFGAPNSTPSPTTDTPESPSPESEDGTKDEAKSPEDGNEGKGRGKKQSAGKRRRVKDEEESDWKENFFGMWEKGMQEDNARFERCMQVFQEGQTQQLKQTNDILAGFQGIFKDILSKND